MAIPKKLTTKPECSAFIENFNTFLFDCDGVLWDGDQILPGVREVLEFLRSKGKRIIFVTNNSTKSRTAYKAKFNKLQIDVSTEEIFGSSYASAVWLRKVAKFPADKKVYIIGQSGIEEELASEGIQYCGAGEDNENVADMSFKDIIPDPQIGAVLCGFDLHINYKKYAKAFTYIRSNPECYFLLTNNDTTYPANGTIFPGTGSIVSPLITSLNRQPDAVLGKPNQSMMDCIKAKYDIDPQTTCMVGDRIDTDIQFGINGGLSTLLVLSGVTTQSELEHSEILPNYYINSLGDLSIAIQ
ncbi:uncharacterized protein VTP21DRAFT_6077 [Calcarisporiella thermophila]|uniref:uncharacterized protein n=1 Tax=Calcarisporiella thermophila TaxID=911321 RepID=UPI0037435D5A